jgi:hypothetical protein
VEIFEAILNRSPVAPVRLNPEIPAELEHIHVIGVCKRPAPTLGATGPVCTKPAHPPVLGTVLCSSCFPTQVQRNLPVSLSAQK